MEPSNTSSHELTGLKRANIHRDLDPITLCEWAVSKENAIQTTSGAIAIHTGSFTGRAPKDRFIVNDNLTEESVWWGDINQPFDANKFDHLFDKVMQYLEGRDIFVRDAYVCADERYRVNVRVITEYAWSNLFAYNMFLRPTKNELNKAEQDWTIICAPGFQADPDVDGTRRNNFSILNFKRKVILIGGTGYTGEMKKGMFSVLNFLLPNKDVLPMHCAANVGKQGDTALFFGLSGTGKTTLSTDPDRALIGDDEHGWAPEDCIFNFEGGCYAKTIDLNPEFEPEIYAAIRSGALLENVGFQAGTSIVDFKDRSVTENTRVSYPIDFISNIAKPSVGRNPKNIFFLTCDAYGVLPPVAKLSPGQAAFHFISGYTAKVAGTEEGITDPVMTFSACFGAPFMPLPPTHYAAMLSEKMKKADVSVWLINTGWSGGPFGVGQRMKLQYTRALISAILGDELNNSGFQQEEVFGLAIPVSCPGVPDELLHPQNTWKNKADYEQYAFKLATAFNENFKKFEASATPEMLEARPKTLITSA